MLPLSWNVLTRGQGENVELQSGERLRKGQTRGENQRRSGPIEELRLRVYAKGLRGFIAVRREGKAELFRVRSYSSDEVA